jgi:hypothetical protein
MNHMSGATLRGTSLVVTSEAPVVGHTQWIAKALSESRHDGLGFVLLTPDTTKITRGLARLLSVLGGLWVVDDGRGSFYLGLSGQAVTQSHGEFSVSAEPSAAYVRGGVMQQRGGVLVQAEKLHPRRWRTTVGGLAEAISQELAGQEPLGWGVQEPVTQPWSIRDISKRYSKRSAENTLLHWVGPLDEHRLVGTLEIQRPRTGIVEYVEGALERPEPLTASEKQSLARVFHEQTVRTATVFQVMGADPTTIPPAFLGYPVPSVAVFGPEALKGVNAAGVVETSLELGAATADLLGESPQSLALTFADEPREGQTHPTDVLAKVTERIITEQQTVPPRKGA